MVVCKKISIVQLKYERNKHQEKKKRQRKNSLELIKGKKREEKNAYFFVKTKEIRRKYKYFFAIFPR